MVQGLQVRDREPDEEAVRVEVSVEARARAEAGWAVRLQQGRAEIVYARVAEQRSPTLRDNRVTKEAVQIVVRK
jgi:hypothetical protein